MWEIANRTSFKVAGVLLRDNDGAEIWVVVGKGTFDIKGDGSTRISDEQVDVCHVAQFSGEAGRSSTRYDVDTVPLKVNTDLLVLGYAYAPAGRPYSEIDVGVRLGSINKTIRVSGDRVWTRATLGMEPSPPRVFERMPLLYERAFGGADQAPGGTGTGAFETRNPVGLGFGTSASTLEGRPLPNLEYPGQLITSWKDRPQPASFGPVSPGWSPRSQFAGTFDAEWQRSRFPLLPRDFDQRFFQCAPLDQWTNGYLRGDEEGELRNVSEAGILRFRLPNVRLTFTTILEHKAVVHRGTLHTVVIEPEHPRMILVWHAALPCHGRAYKLERTTVSEKPHLGL